MVSISWKNYDKGQQKCVIVRPKKGGGTRNVVLPNDATYNDILNDILNAKKCSFQMVHHILAI